MVGKNGIIKLTEYSIRYPDPAIKVNDTVKIDLATGKITDFISFDTGVIAMVTGGRNMGRVGTITHRERHDGGFNIVHVKDAIDNSFATRESNIFVIGQEKPWISLPKGKGVKVRFSIQFGFTSCANYFYSSLLPRRETADVRQHNRCSIILHRSFVADDMKFKNFSRPSGRRKGYQHEVLA